MLDATIEGEHLAKKPLTDWVSPSSFAKYKEITLSQVKDLIESGKLENCWKTANNNRKKINWRAADVAIKAAIIQAEADQDEDPSDGKVPSQILGVNNLTKARTAKTTMEAKSAQLKFEVMSGNLVKTDEVVRVAKEMGRLTKESLLTLPDRLAPVIVGEPSLEKIHAILVDEINTALRNLELKHYDFFKDFYDGDS